MLHPKYRHTSLLKRMPARMRRQPRGQSFIELLFVVMILALLLAGMVEFGFLLNQYLHILDASREAARYSSTQNAFVLNADGVKISSFYYPPFYYQSAAKAALTMYPAVSLDPLLAEQGNANHTDDIVISVFSLDGSTPTRYPTGDAQGWSLCAHFNLSSANAAEDIAAGYSGLQAYFQIVDPTVIADSPPAPEPGPLPQTPWSGGCHVRASQFTIANFTSGLNGVTLATPDVKLPKTGALVVEIFYNYPQLLKLPVLTNVLPDPIPLYVYSIMPLSAAQPTQVPTPP